MLDSALAKVFGTKHDREIKRMRPIVAAINYLEPQTQQLSDADLAAKTIDFKQRIANGAALDDILIEAFAVCREAGRRALNMRHFDVQLIGGIVLHRGRIAEMKTGEGKEPGQSYATGDFTVDEKHRTVALTEEGVLKVEKLLNTGNLYDPANIEMNHHVQQALRAHILYQRDRDYVLQDGQVIIVDEFTGRLMPGRRWSDGLHQAVEAKENVKIERETQTLASITFQNFFRMYKKLAGMTGTADTEAAEFNKIYNLEVTVIPTNQPMIRTEYPDIVYRTEEEKFRNAAKEIKTLNEKGQPVLVGTISVEKSERLSGILKKMGVRHEVLNAKNHEREAHIVAQAGRKGAVTVSTNMAGRGTDILLGGNADAMAKESLRKQGKDGDYMQTCPVGSPERQ